MTLEGISTYTEEANQQCRSLTSFFRRRQEIELEYGTSLANLCMEYKRSSWGDMTPENRAMFNNSNNKLGTRAQLLGLSHWRGVFEAVTMCAGVAETHVQFAVSVQRAIIDPLQGQIREMESMRKAHLDLGKHLSRQLQDAYTEFRVAKEEHDNALVAKNEISDLLSKSQLNNNTKKKEIDKLMTKHLQATERYDIAIKRLGDCEIQRNEAQTDYFISRIPALHMDICNYEEKRLDILKNALTELFHLEQMSYSTRAVWTKATDDLVSSMDANGDINIFKDTYCTEDDRDITLVSVRSLINSVKAGRVQLKRGDNNPDWTNQYFVLMADDGGLLYIFDEEDSEKPTEVIKLSVCTIWSVDDSFFGMANCLQLIINDGVDIFLTYNFIVENAIEKQEWLAELRKLSTGCNRCQEIFSTTTDVQPRSMRLWLVEAKDLPAKSNPFCVVLLDNVKQARTQVRSGDSPFWGEEFSFNDIPPCRSKLRLIFFSNQQGKARDQELGYVSINLSSIKPGKKVEEWGQIISFTQEKTPIGSVRIAYLLSNDTSLPLEGYDQFVSLITESELSVVRFIGNYIGSEKEEFSKIVLNILVAQGKDIQGVKVLAREEIQETEDPNIIFRGNSVATKTLDAYMKLLGNQYLKDSLGSLIKGVYQTKDSCEVDPLRLSKNDDIKKNFKRLSNHVSLFWDAIQSSAINIPIELSYIFKDMSEICDSKFKIDKVKYTAISGFVFLRFFCPAILNPKLFGIMPDHPDPSTARTLTLIAKIIQNLANLSEFEGKEPHMQVFNEWINDHYQAMIEFIDVICEPNENAKPTPRPRINVRYEASALHTLIKSKWELIGPVMETGPDSVRDLKPVIDALDSIVSSRRVHKDEILDRDQFGRIGAPQLPPLDFFKDSVTSKSNSFFGSRQGTLKKNGQNDFHLSAASSTIRGNEEFDDDLMSSTSNDQNPRKKGWRESLLRKTTGSTISTNNTFGNGSPDNQGFLYEGSESLSTSSTSLNEIKTPRTAAKFAKSKGLTGKLKGLLSKQDGTASNNTSLANLPIQN